MALTVVKHAFRGIEVAVAFLILRAGIRMIRGLKKRPMEMAVLAVAGVTMLGINLFGVRLSSIWLILFGAFCGILTWRLAGKAGVRK